MPLQVATAVAARTSSCVVHRATKATSSVTTASAPAPALMLVARRNKSRQLGSAVARMSTTASHPARAAADDDVVGADDLDFASFLKEHQDREDDGDGDDDDDEEDRRRRASVPWHNLLLHPAKASWRSSPDPPPKRLSDVRTDLLRRGGRTSKQLRRTYDAVSQKHADLAGRRERERRRMVNPRGSNYRRDSLAYKKQMAEDAQVVPVFFNPEQALVHVRYRLVPNYLVMKRILRETQSLLGRDNFRPRRIIDVGIGVGSASAAAMDVLGGPDEVDWIHGVDPSRSMRDAAETVLKSMIHGDDDDDEGDNGGRGGDGDDDEGERQRRQRRKSKKRKAPATRVTLGESLTTTSSYSSGGTVAAAPSGSFDLALCAYTLTELPHVASTLALAATLWEKVRPNGVLVFVEPGTPDGFNAVRAVRNMLLDCCPPHDDDGIEEGEDGVGWRREEGDEECRIVAPCTHHGSCPMERHKKNFCKGQQQGGGSKESKGDERDAEEGAADGETGRRAKGEKMDLSGAAMVGADEGEWWHDIDDDDDIVSEEDNELDDEKYAELLGLGPGVEEEGDEFDSNEDGGSSNRSVAAALEGFNLAPTDVFDSSFCSFVHALPGGERGNKKKGEKISYLVLQKRIVGDDRNVVKGASGDGASSNSWGDVNIVDLLSKSIRAASGDSKRRNDKKGADANDRHSETTQSAHLLQRAAELEDAYLDMDSDDLGLEMVQGDDRRPSWGRLVRAPLKKKGHVVLDYCAGGGEQDEEGIRRGRIVRHRVSRGWSARYAPGMFSAARKARWGGLWPDMSKQASS